MRKDTIVRVITYTGTIIAQYKVNLKERRSRGLRNRDGDGGGPPAGRGWLVATGYPSHPVISHGSRSRGRCLCNAPQRPIPFKRSLLLYVETLNVCTVTWVRHNKHAAAIGPARTSETQVSSRGCRRDSTAVPSAALHCTGYNHAFHRPGETIVQYI